MDSNIIILPNGKQFNRKKFTEYSKEEWIEIISVCDNIKHILNILRLNNFYSPILSRFIQDNNINILHFKKVKHRTIEDMLIKDCQSYCSKQIKTYILKNKTGIHKKCFTKQKIDDTTL